MGRAGRRSYSSFVWSGDRLIRTDDTPPRSFGNLLTPVAALTMPASVFALVFLYLNRYALVQWSPLAPWRCCCSLSSCSSSPTPSRWLHSRTHRATRTTLYHVGCCSSTGVCGFTPQHCGTGCQNNCNATSECGAYAAKGHFDCPINICCRQSYHRAIPPTRPVSDDVVPFLPTTGRLKEPMSNIILTNCSLGGARARDCFLAREGGARIGYLPARHTFSGSWA